MLKKIFVFTTVMTFIAVMAYARFWGGYQAPLAETGQTTCYDASGATVTCNGTTGQDGEKRAGVAWPATRFTDNSNGTVTDNLTGLIWLKDANCTFGGSNNYNYWADALTAADGLADGQCGLTDGSKAGDWRLPNVNELESLVHAGYNEVVCDYSTNPVNYCGSDAEWLNKNTNNTNPVQGFFTNVQADSYWSSTTYAYMPGSAWIVSMNFGLLDYDGKTTYPYDVRPVRGGQ